MSVLKNACLNWFKWHDCHNLQIYHNSSNNHSYISESGSGSLIVLADDLYIQAVDTATMIKAVDDGEVELYFNGNKKVETTNTGVTITGGMSVTGTSPVSFGSTTVSQLVLKDYTETVKVIGARPDTNIKELLEKNKILENW